MFFERNRKGQLLHNHETYFTKETPIGNTHKRKQFIDKVLLKYFFEDYTTCQQLIQVHLRTAHAEDNLHFRDLFSHRFDLGVPDFDETASQAWTGLARVDTRIC